MEEEKEQTIDKNKIILVSVAAGLGTLVLGFLIWSAIFSSQFGVFTEDDYHITIKYPQNWTVAKGYAGTVVTFVSPKEDGLDSFQENLNIAVQDLSKPPMTLDQFTELAIKQMNAVFKTNIKVVESKPITYAGLPAYLYAVKATDSKGISLKFIWFIKDDQAYTITCAAQLLRSEKYAGTFDEMLRSFSIPAF